MDENKEKLIKFLFFALCPGCSIKAKCTKSYKPLVFFCYFCLIFYFYFDFSIVYLSYLLLSFFLLSYNNVDEKNKKE